MFDLEFLTLFGPIPTVAILLGQVDFALKSIIFDADVLLAGVTIAVSKL